MTDTALPPVPDIIRSAYATLVVTDLPQARRFWVDLLGFVVSYEDSSAIYLRGYDELAHHNLVLRAGREAAAGRLASDRSEHPERLQQRYDLRRGAEVARFDHFNICVPNVPRAYDYYSGLGFGLSETIEDGQTLYAAWMYRKQTVHDMTFTGGAGPRPHRWPKSRPDPDPTGVPRGRPSQRRARQAGRGPVTGCRRQRVSRPGEGAFFVVKFPFEDAQAGVGQAAGVAPAQQFIALRVDHGPATPQRRVIARRARRFSARGVSGRSSRRR